MRNGNDIILEYLNPIERRHEEPVDLTFVLLGECESGDCKSCPQMVREVRLGWLACSCDCHHRDGSRHKAGAA